MASPKRFPTLVQLEQREGTLFQVLGNLTKRPYWFHNEYLKNPKAVHLEAWLVEAIFGQASPVALASIRAPVASRVLTSHTLSASCAGPGGEHIPHVECVSQTLLHVHQWDSEDEAEILIFGRPSYQKDVSKMIMNLAYYHRQLRAQSSVRDAAQETGTQNSPDSVREAATQSSPDSAREAATQRSPDAAREAATQRSPDALREAATQRSPDALREAATQRSPDALREAATQSSPDATVGPVPRL
ncbi:ES cell-associated transcript 1 protein [Pteropus alecto]|uniref:ES cell-associated transcript 1 protein n=1 Tax=Pteropus alecto TaxID=9402 RepID=L5JL70_PTEAL|nr:ES cell-associated transcript 1 protein [Pteropus alecto]